MATYHFPLCCCRCLGNAQAQLNIARGINYGTYAVWHSIDVPICQRCKRTITWTPLGVWLLVVVVSALTAAAGVGEQAAFIGPLLGLVAGYVASRIVKHAVNRTPLGIWLLVVALSVLTAAGVAWVARGANPPDEIIVAVIFGAVVGLLAGYIASRIVAPARLVKEGFLLDAVHLELYNPQYQKLFNKANGRTGRRVSRAA